MAMNTSPIRRIADEVTRLPEGAIPDGSAGTILDVALRLFAERGFSGASIRDIAAEAGLRSATLYGQYPSKAHILAEIIRIGHAEHHRELRAALQAACEGPREQLIALVRAHVRTHAQYPMLAMVTNNELHCLSPEQAAEGNALRHQSELMMLQVLQSGIRQGLFDVDNPMLALAAIGGMGLRVANWYKPELGVSVEEVADSYARYACRIVGACCRHDEP